MLTRLSIVAASLAALVVAAAPAQSQTDIPAPSVQPGQCTDPAAPKSGIKNKDLKRFKRTHVLRGTARDSGCGVDRVEVSLALKKGKKCRYLVTASRLSRRGTSCGRASGWQEAKGSSSWTFKLPKRMAKGVYVLRTRASDLGGNIEHVRSRKIRIR